MEHIAFIMDGNRRYAKKQEIDKKEGYLKGIQKFMEIVSYQIKYKITETSFFALSSDNYKNRTNDDLDPLANLIENFYKNLKVKKFFIENNIEVAIKGDIDEVAKNEKKTLDRKHLQIKDMQKELDKWNEKSKPHKFKVNIALNYDGHNEIVQAVKKIAKKIKDGELKDTSITDKTIKKHLWFDSKEPDIIVRTGDAPRLSGFMLWDSKYSEIYLTKKLWPELDETDFIAILDWFKNIKRNFGK